MVFESLVADLLNKYLGNFVENLDRSQLKIGIWGGDVVLNNLKLKQSALDDLELPIQVVYGHLGRLVLKIPWKNLYNAPVEVAIEQLYLLAKPGSLAPYDESREEKALQEAKKGELKRYEEHKMRQTPAPPAQDSLAEKLAAQVIKNLQLSFKDVHIRYEDPLSRPGSAFAFGLTLHSLSISTSPVWESDVKSPTENLVFKKLVLEALALYWNSDSVPIGDPKTDLRQAFHEGVASRSFSPAGFYYAIGPLCASADLRLAPRPETLDYTVPKLTLQWRLEALGLRLGRSQLRDLLALCESQNCLHLQARYRRYRPNVTSYRGHYVKWWHYAYKCILETEVRRRHDNWNWVRIATHRETLRQYRTAYASRVATNRPTEDLLRRISELEATLDSFNIILIREQVDASAPELPPPPASGGFFSRWWGGASQEPVVTDEDDLAAQFQKAMTPAEKAKLYAAIDYQEGATPEEYPESFCSMDILFELGKWEVQISGDNVSDPPFLKSALVDVSCSIRQLPKHSSLVLDLSVRHLTAVGRQQTIGDGTVIIPRLIESRAVCVDVEQPVFKFHVATNPVDGKCDTRIHISAMPLRIVYDALTVNSIFDVFAVEGKTAMQPIQQAASMKLAELRQKSSLGLQYVIDHHKVFDVQVDIMASHIILPKTGFYYKENIMSLILNLGRFRFYSKPRTTGTVNVKALHQMGHTEEEILSEMLSHSYDNYVINLTDLQVLFVLDGETWDLDKGEVNEMLYLLKPTSLVVNMAQCIIHDDPRLPKIKIDGQLPNISVNLVDKRALDLISLLFSIPRPESTPEPPALPDLLGAAAFGSSASIAHLGLSRSVINQAKAAPHTSSDEDMVQFTELEINFELKIFSVNLMKQMDTKGHLYQRLLDFEMMRLEVGLIKKTFNLSINASLGGLAMQQAFESGTVKLLNSPMAEGLADYLVVLRYSQVDKASPEFHSKYGSVLQLIEVDFTKLDVQLHQEAILMLAALVNEISARISVDASSILPPPPTPHPPYQKALSIIKEEGITFSSRLMDKSHKHHVFKRIEVIAMKIAIQMRQLNVHLSNSKGILMELGVDGGIAVVTMKKSYTQIEASLMGLSIHDPKSLYYKKVLTVIDEKEALVVKTVLFDQNDPTRKADVSLKVSMACVRLVYLNRFLSSIIDFMNNFQTAQEALVGATQAAAEKAKHNVKDAYQNAIRICMDIQVKAPIIVIPVNSKELKGLLFDFGYLNIGNNIVNVTINDQKEPAVLDNISVELEELKVSMVELDEDLKIINEQLIFRPISFKLQIQRNLSSAWYSGVPDVEISGRLKAVQILFSHLDYKTIMRITTENIGDTNQSHKQPAQKAKPMKPVERKLFPSIPSELVSKNVATLSQKQYITMKFYFTMESLELELLNKENETAPSERLALFKLLIVSMRGSILSDDSLHVSLLLVDCLMDDLRSSQVHKINRYMSSKHVIEEDMEDMSDVPKRMLDVTYQKNDSGMFVDLRVSSFNLILNVDHLLKIAAVFDLTDKEEQKQEPVPLKQVKSQQSRRAIDISQEPPNSSMTLNLMFEHPDIILVENMNDINTNALVLQANIIFKAKFLDESKYFNGTIEDFQLWSCCYNPLIRLKTKAPVVKPLSIFLNGSTPKKSGLHVDICTTNLALCVTADTINLLSNVYSAVSPKPQEVETKSTMVVNNSKLWDVSSFDESDYLFLAIEVGEEVTELPGEESGNYPSNIISEVCIFSVPSMIITIESGSGTTRVPMMLLESSIQATVKDWSFELNVDSQVTLKLSYYNSSLAVWEPLIEPVEVIKGHGISFTPWELTVLVETAKPSHDHSSAVAENKLKPKMSVFIVSKEILNITLSKTCLEVINTLSSSFSDAIYKPTEKHAGETAQYTLVNDTGIPIVMLLQDSDFILHDHALRNSEVESKQSLTEEINQVILDHGAKVNLCPAEDVGLSMAVISLSELTNKEKFISINVTDFDTKLQLPVLRADKRYFFLKQRSSLGSEQWGIMSHITIINGTTVITLRGILQVENLLSVPVNVYYMMEKGNALKSVGIIKPSRKLNIPLHAIYTPTGELFFSVEGYSVSTSPFIWKDLQKSLEQSMLIQCNPKNREDGEPFFIRAVGEMEQVYFGLTTRHTMASNCYNIALRPAVVLKNILLVDVIVCIQGLSVERIVKPGELLQIPTAEPGNSSLVIRIHNYLDRDWSCKKQIVASPAEFTVWTFESFESEKATLCLGMHTSNRGGSLILSLYCPFWVVNHTGLNISYRQSDDHSNIIHHPANVTKPMFFSFNSRAFFSKKKACVRVEDSPWSDKFPIDVAGSSGVVGCKKKDKVLQIAVHIRLLTNALTKQVTFSPLFVIINNCDVHMQLREYNEKSLTQSDWITVECHNCLPFWPHHDHGYLILKVLDTNETTIPFQYHESHNSVFKLNNSYGAVCVDVQIGDGKIHINIYPYEIGMAPAVILNHTPHLIVFNDRQAKKDGHFSLKPMERKLFTWGFNGPHNLLRWSDDKYSHTLKEDGIGEFTMADGGQGYWVSFLYGLQRVLLLTGDRLIAYQAQSISDFDAIETAVNFSFHGFGISLVNDERKIEVLYLGVNSTGVIWETKKQSKKRFKPMSSNDSSLIENAYNKYQAQISADENPEPVVTIDGRLQVNFITMTLLKPTEKCLQRRYNTGLWINLNLSPRQLQIHAQINRIQIDNQMFDCIFPVVLCPVPPPKSIALKNVHKPFVEISIVKRLNTYSGVQQYKYFKVLVQEFHVRVDMGFINALIALFQSKEKTDEEQFSNFLKDLALADEPLVRSVALSASTDQKNFYDNLHLSPLKIHLSFSLAGTESGRLPELMNLVAQSFGVTVTDVNDVILKLAYFERQYQFLSSKQLSSQVTSHYISQLLRQFYVVVLGLDVIGNPLGLVVGLTQGATDLFYEPFQGAIQGPGEFAEGLALGVRSLFGHTVGGAAGAFSKITGAMGKGLAALTFDRDFQKQRREALVNRPANVQEGLAQSGRGLVMGVVEGVGGIVTKPIEGARQEGFQGFLKGVGKGMVGLVTRPTAGVVDFASGSLSAVKRATDLSEECRRIRCPRNFESDGLVRPYSKVRAEGHKLLVDLERGKYLATDAYIFHMPIGLGKKKDALLITDQRIFYLAHNELFGGYQLEWSHTWAELSGPPQIVSHGVQLPVMERSKGAKFFSGPTGGKVLLISDEETKKFLVDKITQLMGQGNVSFVKSSITSLRNRSSPKK